MENDGFIQRTGDGRVSVSLLFPLGGDVRQTLSTRNPSGSQMHFWIVDVCLKEVSGKST